MTSRTCIYCESAFSDATGEHILQNSFGARWTSDEIVCNECQSVLGETIDASIAKQFSWLRNLFGLKSGRGQDPPLIPRLKTDSAKVIDLEPNGIPRLNRPHFTVSSDDGNRASGQIALGTAKHLGWALKEIKDKFPNAEIELGDLVQSSGPLGEAVHLRADLGGTDYGRAVVKACFNLYSVCFPSEARRVCFDPLRKFVLEGLGDVTDFLRWPTVALATGPRGDLEHQITLVHRGPVVEGWVVLFGHLHHAVRLTATYDGTDLGPCGYTVDPFREHEPAEHRNSSFDVSSIPQFSAQPAELGVPGRELIASGLTELGAVHWRRDTVGKLYDAAVSIRGKYSAQLTDSDKEQLPKEYHREVVRIVEAALARTFADDETQDVG